jgi:DNA-binding NarL/FixJ family response regulator
MTIGVLLADDQELMRMGFRMVIDSQPDMAVVGEVANGRDAIDAVAALVPEVVLMDVRMPEMDGVQATRLLTEADSPARIIILTTFDLDEYVYAALRARVTRRLLSTFSHRLPARGELGAEERDRLELLTAREREVLLEVAQSLTNAEIAERLVLSEATVKTHVGRILSKLELRDRVQIVVFAYETGLITPSPD